MDNAEMRQFSVGAVGFFSNRKAAKDLAKGIDVPQKSFVVVRENAVSYFGKSLAMRFLGQVDDLEDQSRVNHQLKVRMDVCVWVRVCVCVCLLS